MEICLQPESQSESAPNQHGNLNSTKIFAALLGHQESVLTHIAFLVQATPVAALFMCYMPGRPCWPYATAAAFTADATQQSLMWQKMYVALFYIYERN